MSFDPVKNFAYGTVLTAPSPATTGTSLVLNSGEGARFPDPATEGAYNITVWEDAVIPLSSNSEIVRVTAKSTDTLTITRTQESTSARTIVVGDQVALTLTKKKEDDVIAAIPAAPNLLKNGNFINNSTNGYGSTPDDWTSSSANPVQGGMPSLTKAELISILGIADGDIEGLWNLNEASGNATDLSSNSYDLTDTNTVGNSLDGLLPGGARDFESTNSEYFAIANGSCPNLEITGSQTWITFFKPETISGGPRLMSKGINLREVILTSSFKPQFTMVGLTTATIGSDVILETGKWYAIIGVYDSSASKLKIWVNGIKKEVTASGTATSSSNEFAIGRPGGTSSNYTDGLLQNSIIINGALTDEQAKRLVAHTMYKGLKVRRATTDALIYQDLSQDLVARLRGKELTLRALVNAESTNHRIYIYDGTTTTAVSPSAADTSEVISATATIDSDATQIRIGIEADTTDGNMWVEQVALYEAGNVLPYDHSKDDWSRFPELLILQPFDSINGYKNEGLVKFSVLEQNGAATSTYRNNTIILTGWGSKSASGNFFQETVTMGLTFTTEPIIIASPSGRDQTGTKPTTLQVHTEFGGYTTIDVVQISSSSFQVGYSQCPAGDGGTRSLSTSYYYAYSWIAIGTI